MLLIRDPRATSLSVRPFGGMHQSSDYSSLAACRSSVALCAVPGPYQTWPPCSGDLWGTWGLWELWELLSCPILPGFNTLNNPFLQHTHTDTHKDPAASTVSRDVNATTTMSRLARMRGDFFLSSGIIHQHPTMCPSSHSWLNNRNLQNAVSSWLEATCR